MNEIAFPDLNSVAEHLRHDLQDKKYVLLYAYNGTGKTRLSMRFKDLGKNGDARDTLYFNAFTEDLFTWDNDLQGDSERELKLNSTSRFFVGLESLEMESRIRRFLNRYTDFDFNIDYTTWTIRFSRAVQSGDATQTVDYIKVSRGEEKIFVWCFFLAVLQLAMDGEEAYKWVKFVYIDDPISSLDEQNAIAVASNFAQLFKQHTGTLRVVISSHHALFFNVLCNELGKAKKYFLSSDKKTGKHLLRDTGETPFFHHVAMLAELYQAESSGKLYTYHFNILRTILEKTASFHGFKDFSSFIKKEEGDLDDVLHKRLLDLLSHGNYSLFEPREMQEETKGYFKKILDDFLSRYPFNPELFPEELEEANAS